jgi:hypothetical protein
MIKRPVMRITFIKEIQNSVSPKNLADHKFNRAYAAIIAIGKTIGCTSSVQNPTTAVNAVISKLKSLN